MSANQQDNHNFESPYQNTGFDAEFAQPPRTRRSGGCCFFGCCLGCLGFLLLIAIGFFAFWYCLMSGGAELIVSEETTVITEPLKSDGKSVDFFRAIQEMTEPAIPANENGFRDIFLGYGQAVFINDAGWQYAETCNQLGIAPQTPPPFSLPTFNPDSNSLPRWLDIVEAGLDTIHTAAAKPHYVVPLVRQNENDFVLFSLPVAVYGFHEKLTEVLRAHSYNRYQSEDIDGYWKDTLTTLRLFRFVTIHQAWLKALGWDARKVRILEHDNEVWLLTDVDEVAVTLPKWTPEQLAQGIKDLESLPNWQDRETMLKTIQFMLLDVMSATNDWDGLLNLLGNNTESEMRQATLGMFQMIAFDWNLVAKELNSKIRAFGELMKRAEGMSLDEQFELLQISKTDEELDEEKIRALLEDYVRTTGDFPLFTSGRSRLAGGVAGELVKTAAQKLYRLQLMEESRCQALRLALALELYRREHQNYPDSLDALGLKAMPVNVSLEYEKRDAGYRIHNKLFELER